MRQSTALAVATVLAFIGLDLLKGSVGEILGGLFLLFVAIWMGVAVLRRGIIR